MSPCLAGICWHVRIPGGRFLMLTPERCHSSRPQTSLLSCRGKWNTDQGLHFLSGLQTLYHSWRMETRMSTPYWHELYTGPWIVGGNVAKVKVVHELQRLIANGTANSILDIGIVGPQPLEFWEPLLEGYSAQFHLTGIDVWGIDKARQVVEQHGWEKQVTLQQGSGYALQEIFGPKSFDLVVAMQVLEHIAQLPRFIQQVA